MIEIENLKKQLKNNHNKNNKTRENMFCKTRKNGKHKNCKIKNTLVIEENYKNPQKHLAVELINKIKTKNKRILLVDLKLNRENLHILFHKANIYKQIENKNFLIHINKNLKLLTGLSKIIKNNTEKEINKIFFLINKNSKNFDYIFIEISENNFSTLNKKTMEKIKNNIIVFSNNINSIKNTKEKIKNYKGLKFNLFLTKENSENNQEKISIEILKEIFKKIKIIRKEKQIWKLMN